VRQAEQRRTGQARQGREKRRGRITYITSVMTNVLYFNSFFRNVTIL
jgi:hypothetical protein